ncbi:hypothetical protein Golomagni_05884 [Golovinomyces magnicellulatus]|nr:hypothetical protein Golomagni_05884 [Golovinomyces magnicellulatus]
MNKPTTESADIGLRPEEAMGKHVGTPNEGDGDNKTILPPNDETATNVMSVTPATQVSTNKITSENTSVTGLDRNENEKRSVTSPANLTRTITGWRWFLIIFAILSSTFLFALDNTIVADIQPVIVVEFNSISKISWISSTLLITAAATNLIWGKIFGQFEAKWTYILCVLLFEIGSAICGAAQNIETMIIGRAICGFGGSGMYVGVMTLLAANTTLKERPIYIGSTGLTWGLGTVLGPIVGGAFSVSSAGWRWSFYINLCVGVICAPIYIFMIPRSDPHPGVKFFHRARQMDYMGTILTAGAFASGVMAISFGGIQYKWSSPEIITMFVSSAVLFTLLGVQQVYTIFTNLEQRVFPVEFFKSRTMLSIFCCTAAGGALIFVPIYMIPLFFQFAHNDTALESGVRLLPFIFVLVIGICFNGALLSRYGLYMPWFTAGGAFCIIGSALMYNVTRSTSIGTVYIYTVIVGWGCGIFAQSGFSISQAIVEPHIVPIAIGFITCAQITGATIALSIANSIFINKSKDALFALLPEASKEQIETAISGSGSSFFRSLSIDLQEKVLEAIVQANSTAYILTIVAGAVVMIVSLGMKRERLFIAPV